MSELSSTLSEAFDTANEEGSPAFEPLSPGAYVASIIDAKVGPLKSGKGQAVLLQWEIQGGANQGRVIFDRVIVAHESAEAMRAGLRVHDRHRRRPTLELEKLSRVRVPARRALLGFEAKRRDRDRVIPLRQ